MKRNARGRQIHDGLLRVGRPAAALVLGLALTTRAFAQGTTGDFTISTREHEVVVTRVAEGMAHPWAMAFLPDGSLLVTEREGELTLIPDPLGAAEEGRGRTISVADPPEVAVAGQGGLLDIALHPDYRENGWIYFSYSASVSGGYASALGRGRLAGAGNGAGAESPRLTDWQELFVMESASGSTRHFGSRIVFGRDGYLYMTIGDRGDGRRGEAHPSQDAGTHIGSTLRLTETGAPAPGNPFAGEGLPEIYSIGHRNAQGMTVHPETGAIWQSEHGPEGGDELNVIRPGANYGWPVITHGSEYSGGPVGEGRTSAPGMEQPVTYWVPTSIAPADMDFYSGDVFPAWQGDLFVGALAQRHLRRVVLDGETVEEQEEILRNRIGRIRDVQQGPEGYLWLLTDADNGALYRLSD